MDRSHKRQLFKDQFKPAISQHIIEPNELLKIDLTGSKNQLSLTPPRQNTSQNHQQQLNRMNVYTSFDDDFFSPSHAHRSPSSVAQEEKSDDMIYLENLINKYDQDTIPPNLELAKLHEKASVFGIIDVDHSYHLKCPCCHQSLAMKPVSSFTDSEQLDSGGSCIPLFYNFIKHCKIILLLMVIITAIYSIINNSEGQFCNNEIIDDQGVSCIASFYSHFSLANIKQRFDRMQNQSYLNLYFSIFLMIFLVYFRNAQVQLDQQIDQKYESQKHFTLIVKNLPPFLQIDYLTVVKDLIETHEPFMSNNQSVKVVKCRYIYDNSHLKNLERYLQEKVIEKQFLLSDENSDLAHQWSEVEKIEDEIQNIKNLIIERSSELRKNPGLFFSGQLFVTFDQLKFRNQVYQMTQQPNWYTRLAYTEKYTQVQFEKRILEFNEAPDPEEVIWKSIFIDNQQRQRLKIINLVLFTIVLSFCFMLTFVISYQEAQLIYREKIRLESEREKYIGNLWIRIFHFINSIGVILINNLVLPRAATYFTDSEQFSNQTAYYSALGKQLSIALFTNTAMVSFWIKAVELENVYGEGGIIGAQSEIFITNLVVSPLLNLIDFTYIFKWVNQRYVLYKLQNHRCFLTQQELNEVMEPTQFNIAQNYATVINIMWATFLYSSLIPIAPLINLFYLIIFTYINKFNLVNKRTLKNRVGREVSENMIDLLQLCNISFAFGTFYFYYAIFNRVQIQQCIQIVLSILYFWIPHELQSDLLCSYFKKSSDSNNTMRENQSLQQAMKKTNLQTYINH